MNDMRRKFSSCLVLEDIALSEVNSLGMYGKLGLYTCLFLFKSKSV